MSSIQHNDHLTFNFLSLRYMISSILRSELLEICALRQWTMRHDRAPTTAILILNLFPVVYSFIAWPRNTGTKFRHWHGHDSIFNFLLVFIHILNKLSVQVRLFHFRFIPSALHWNFYPQLGSTLSSTPFCLVLAPLAFTPDSSLESLIWSPEKKGV